MLASPPSRGVVASTKARHLETRNRVRYLLALSRGSSASRVRPDSAGPHGGFGDDGEGVDVFSGGVGVYCAVPKHVLVVLLDGVGSGEVGDDLGFDL